jgi:3-methyladenine DNA glycosylase/8-oxoguanine DNA glycosylase
MRFVRRFTETIQPIPPYSFELTVRKPAGWPWLTLEEVYENGVLWTATRIRSTILGLRLRSNGTLRRPCVTCDVFSKIQLSKEQKQMIVHRIRRYLGADEDIREFCTVARRDEILKETAKRLCGMRDTVTDLFPSLLLATTLQMAPIKRSEQMMDLLVKHFGDTVCFDRKKVILCPSAERIAKVSVRDLKRKCKLGYRAKNLKAIARCLVKGFPDIEELAEMSPEDAKTTLMELRGIGEYSVGIVSPHPEFPVDSWSSRIFHILFFGEDTKLPKDMIQRVQEEAERRWGPWKGLAFIYVLNDLKGLSERYAIDFTTF